MEMVKAIGLKKYYVTDSYEVHALDGVTFSVEDGEFLAIVGTSGSGKTTLLNLLGGLDVPTEGGVWIRGKSLKDSGKIWKQKSERYSADEISDLYFSSTTWFPCSVCMKILYFHCGWMEQGSIRNSLRKS